MFKQVREFFHPPRGNIARQSLDLRKYARGRMFESVGIVCAECRGDRASSESERSAYLFNQRGIELRDSGTTPSAHLFGFPNSSWD